MLKRVALVIAGLVLALTALGGLALADDGGLMQRMMGHDAFTAMVQAMRGALGNERADQMIASCETHMAEADQATPGMTNMMNGMGGMMNGMGGMMGGSGMSGMMGGR